MNRRNLLVAVGWLGAAGLAVLVGLAAISVIGNGLTQPETRPLSAAEVADELARQVTVSPSAAVGAGSRPAPTSSPAAPTVTFPTRAGTVVGRCAGSRPEVVSMSPRQGYELHEQDRGWQDDDAEGEFRSQSDGRDRVKFEIVCRAGRPVLVADD
ncbi:hypothetical protein GCM10020358_10530 [Amorphoplanes nipponensis]|uniref:Septum formation initiator n=1 Tax=Actinoplanes nipponensis TaxID=135950 RepID=A0A919J8Y6_9ACTN|nr:hypothetical protein [Actinoplanes nipponensis]GIE46589.1 hypothetical protein Ani05nite_01230 [Actinoplanes nipponensis]